MVRTYKQRNQYCRNCKLSDEQFLAILDCYLRFESPLNAAKTTHLPRQTVGSHYLKIGKYIARHFLGPVWQPPFADSTLEDILARSQSDDHKAVSEQVDRLWKESYEHFSQSLPRDEYETLRKKGRQPVDKHIWWIVCRELWDRWGRIPRDTYRYHFALVIQTVRVREHVAGVFMKEYHPTILLDPAVVQKAIEVQRDLFSGLLRKRPL